MKHLHCDFETFSEINLKTKGTAVYARHPSTEALMLSWKINEGPVSLWDIAAGEPMPAELNEALKDPEFLVWAFNAPFEWAIFWYVLGYEIPIRRFRCTMVLAYALSFKGSLDEVLQQIGFGDQARKIKGGAQLIARFCKPQGSKRKMVRWDHRSDPLQWAVFKGYCIQDTAIEFLLYNWLIQFFPMSEGEWGLWFLDQKINQAGAPVDLKLCKEALALHKHAKAEIKKDLQEITELPNPLSNQQMRGWLEEAGSPVPNLKEATVENMLPQMEGMPRRVLESYYQATRTAGTKWKAFLERANEDGRLRGAFQFGGAGRTRRWAGRGVQLHNLRSGPVDGVVAEVINTGHLQLLEALYGRPMEVLASSIRAAVTASPGKSLVVADLTSIESVVLGHLSGCQALEQIYRSGKDAYRVFAQQYFHIPYEQVTKAQRTFSKPPVLGCGFGLGWKGLIEYAKGYGVTMTKQEAETAVDIFRSGYPEIPNMWYGLMEGIEGILTSPPGIMYEWFGVRIYRNSYFMFIELPSGRRLAYYHPVWQEWETPVGTRPSFTYMGVDRFTLKWQRIASHGGMVTENIVQAVARDILAEGMKRYDRMGGNIVFHVHDEIGAEEDTEGAWAKLELLKACMTERPAWLPNIWLGAGGWVGKRYRKD